MVRVRSVVAVVSVGLVLGVVVGCSPAPWLSSALWVGDSISFGPARGFGFAGAVVEVTRGSDRFVGGSGAGR